MSVALHDPRGRNGHSANKVQNAYALSVGGALYEEIPKAVWAAIAVSALTCGGDQIDEAAKRVAAEWWALYDAGIVPQPPGRFARQVLRAADGATKTDEGDAS
jgi:hypothetical protein